MTSLRRRDLLLAAAPILVGALGACSRKGERCGFCGMVVDRTSPWAAQVVAPGGAATWFDTPKCALLAWRTAKVQGTPRFQEFYERAWRDAEALVFAIGSDVVGPMGGDAVPVDPARAAKFTTDHAAARTARAAELDVDALRAL